MIKAEGVMKVVSQHYCEGSPCYRWEAIGKSIPRTWYALTEKILVQNVEVWNGFGAKGSLAEALAPSPLSAGHNNSYPLAYAARTLAQLASTIILCHDVQLSNINYSMAHRLHSVTSCHKQHRNDLLISI